MAFCTKCGAQVNDGNAFCNSCGAKMNGAPQAKQEDATPTFTPPTAPTFAPPPPSQRSVDNPCYFHSDERAVTNCACCGKQICRDCAESYKVTLGEYAGRALCYDCCRAMVAENVEILKKDRTTIITSLALTLVGAIIGLIIGFSEGAGGGAFVYAAIGACFWMFIKDFFVILWESIKSGFGGGGFVGAIISFIVGMFIAICKAIIFSVIKICRYTYHIIRTSSFVASDSAALQQMADYMEYTLVRSRNKGVDLETLMAQDSALYNNSFAQAVQSQGEAAAEANLRRSVMTIAENGEIIRNFAA